MKRWLTAVPALLMCVFLCACGSTAEPETELVPLSPVAESVTASESDAADAAHEAPASDTDAAAPEPEADAAESAPDPRYEQAQEYIGHTAEELFAAIGEPDSSQYASSCEVDGGEDGMQFYDGFYVWTLRTADEELVRAVYLDD